MRIGELFNELSYLQTIYGNIRVDVKSLEVVTTQVKDELGKVRVEKVVRVKTKGKNE